MKALLPIFFMISASTFVTALNRRAMTAVSRKADWIPIGLIFSVGSHRLTDPGLVEKIKNTGKYVLFQTEIITGDSINNWPVQKAFSEVQLPLMRNATSIWTGAVSKARLQEMGIHSEIFTMGYHPAMEEIQPKRNKDIDFLFCGSITPHRKMLLEALTARGGTVVTIFDDAAMYRNDLIARTRVNLAPNQGPGMNHFSGSRVLYLINNRSIVVVERCHDQAMYEHCFPSADTESMGRSVHGNAQAS